MASVYFHVISISQALPTQIQTFYTVSHRIHVPWCFCRFTALQRCTSTNKCRFSHCFCEVLFYVLLLASPIGLGRPYSCFSWVAKWTCWRFITMLKIVHHMMISHIYNNFTTVIAYRSLPETVTHLYTALWNLQDEDKRSSSVPPQKKTSPDIILSEFLKIMRIKDGDDDYQWQLSLPIPKPHL